MIAKTVLRHAAPVTEMSGPALPGGNERGFALIELVMAMAILAIVATPLLGVTTAAMSSHKFSRERTLAQQYLGSQIEAVRALPYSSVGVPNGNPSGTLQPTATVNQAGLLANVATQVTYVNDPVPNGYVTYADYKKVAITLTRIKDGALLGSDVTYVAPPGHGTYGPVGQALVKVRVQDMGTSAFLAGSTVSLATGPDAPRSDTTDGSGTVIFPDLTPNPTSGAQAYYDVSAALTGYQALSDDQSPSTVAHVQLAPSQQFNTVLRVYKPSTLNITVLNSSGGLYSGTATVSVGSSRKAQTFSVTGGTLAVTQLNGEPLVPNLSYTGSAQTAAGNFAPAVSKNVPDAYPTTLTSSMTLTLSSSAYTLKTLTVNVNNSGGAAVNGARVDVTAGPVPIFLTGTTNSSGVATFNVPSGAGYTVTATSGALTGSWSGSVTSATTANVTVR